MRRFLVAVYAMILLGTVSSGQEANSTLTIKAKVKNLPESQYAEGVLPPESSSQMVTFDVHGVCVGEYRRKEIKVAFRGGGERTLVNDEELVIKVRPTTNYREAAKFLLMDLGIVIPEEVLADYEFESTVGPRACN